MDAIFGEESSDRSETRAWLSGLPRRVRQLERRWSLRLLEAFDGEEVSCAWVARVLRADGAPAVLKLAMPHLEGKHEIDGLLFWNGDAAVRVLEAGTIARVSELSGLSAERVQSWTFAPVAVELATAQPGDSELRLARALARSLL